MLQIAKILPAILACLLLSDISSAAGSAEEIFASAQRGVVAILATDGRRNASSDPLFAEEMSDGRILGSGIVISADGLIMTAHHTLASVHEFSVMLSDSREVPATLVAAEPCLDIALVRVAADGLHVIPWRLDPPVRTGEDVFAVGTPAVFSGDPTLSITRGIVSALHRSIETPLSEIRAAVITDLIETDAQLAPGESGGALLDSQGLLVGMCVAVYHPRGAARGRAYAVPVDAWLKRSLELLRATGSVPVGKLGAQVATLTLSRARRLGLEARSGVQVSSLETAGPLETAGVLVGDVITRLNAAPVRQATRFRQREMRLEPGSTATVTVVRAASPKPLQLTVVVGKDGAAMRQRESEFVWRGMRVSALTDEIRKKFSTRVRDGVLVISLNPTGNAWRAGLREGDVIVEINNVAVKTLADFRNAVANVPDSNIVRVKTNSGLGHIHGESFPK